eukprot:6974650-Pyramimonas_sp.AAC.1
MDCVAAGSFRAGAPAAAHPLARCRMGRPAFKFWMVALRAGQHARIQNGLDPLRSEKNNVNISCAHITYIASTCTSVDWIQKQAWFISVRFCQRRQFACSRHVRATTR